MADFTWPSLASYADIYRNALAPLPDAGLGPMTPATQAGRPNAVLSRFDPQRPSDAMAPVSHTLADVNPLVAAYVAGQAAGQAGIDAYQGNYSGAGQNALMAAFAFPGLKPVVRSGEQIMTREAELNALRNHPRDVRDVAFPSRPEIKPEAWHPPSIVDEMAAVAPVVGPIGGAGSAAIYGGDIQDIGEGFVAGGAAAIGARYGLGALKRNMPPRNAGAIATSDAAHLDSLESAIAQQKRVNQELLSEYNNKFAPNDTRALTYEPNAGAGMNQQRPLTSYGFRGGLRGYVDPMADPKTPIERPNPKAQMAYELQEKARLAVQPRLDAHNKALDVERFAKNFDNPQELQRNLRLYSDVSGLSIEEIVGAMRARGLRVDNLSQHTIQTRDHRGRLQKLAPEALEYLRAIRKQDRGLE